MEKVYALHRCLTLNKRGADKARLIQVVGGSESTLFRTLSFMRKQLNAPIESSRKTGLYRYVEGSEYELPGIWFSGAELGAFLELSARLEEMQAEFLDGFAMGPLRERLEAILKAQRISPARMRDCVRFLPIRSRTVNGEVFHTIMDALLQRKRLRIRHSDADGDQILDREISPIRVVRYRDNWYLDAYCHLRDDFRNFGVSGIQSAEKTGSPVEPVQETRGRTHFASSYGIFGGKADKTAEIWFSGAAARFVAQESWHPEQVRTQFPDGRLSLRIPYRDHRELLGDVLRYGEEAEIAEPPELRQAMVEKLKGLQNKYGL